MNIMLDTNVVLDILENRAPYFDKSYAAVKCALISNAECLISASAVTDIFYLLRKYLGSSEKAKEQVENILGIITAADVLSSDINTALRSEMPDFEDALVDAVARRCNAVMILTRNKKDFDGSKVCAITPSEYLEKAEKGT